MGGHEHGNSGAYGSLKRFKFYVAQSLYAVSDDRCVEVAVQVCVAMSRKVFSAGDDAFVKEALHEGEGVVADALWCGAEGAFADDWIVRVGMDVEDGGKIEVEAEVSEGSCDILCVFACFVWVVSAEVGSGREVREADIFGESLDFATFLIHGNPCGIMEGEFVDRACEGMKLCGVGDVSSEEDDAADLVFEKGAGKWNGQLCAFKADDEELSDGLLERQCHNKDTPWFMGRCAGKRHCRHGESRQTEIITCIGCWQEIYWASEIEQI